MTQTLGYVALVVRDYDEAIAYFTNQLGFELIEDSPSKDRWGRDLQRSFGPQNRGPQDDKTGRGHTQERRAKTR